MLAFLSTPRWRLVRRFVAVLLIVAVTAFADPGMEAMSHVGTAGLPGPSS